VKGLVINITNIPNKTLTHAEGKPVVLNLCITANSLIQKTHLQTRRVL